MNARLHVEAHIGYDAAADPKHRLIVIELFNVGDKPARIWEPGESSLWLEVRAKDSEAVHKITGHRDFVLTLDGAVKDSLEIPPGESVECAINPYDEYRWLIPDECWELGDSIEFRYHFGIRGSHDQREYKVTTCDVFSPWVSAEAIRRWLPADRPWDPLGGIATGGFAPRK